MKTEWDYTELAEAYLKRPDYAPKAIERILSTASVNAGGGGLSVILAQAQLI